MADEIEVMHTGERQEACKTVEGELCLLHTAAPELMEAVKELKNQLVTFREEARRYYTPCNERINLISASLLIANKALKSAGVEI